MDSVVRRTIKSTLIMSPRVSTICTYTECPAIKFLNELNKYLLNVDLPFGKRFRERPSLALWPFSIQFQIPWYLLK